MQAVLLRLVLVALVAAPVLAAPGPGISVAVVDRISAIDDAFTISGVAFHTGGAALTQLNVYLDCDPRTVATCTRFPLIVFHDRPDIVNLLRPYIEVPDWIGWSVGGTGWRALAAGAHTVITAWTDAEHGRQQWMYAVKAFTKCEAPPLTPAVCL